MAIKAEQPLHLPTTSRTGDELDVSWHLGISFQSFFFKPYVKLEARRLHTSFRPGLIMFMFWAFQADLRINSSLEACPTIL